MHVGLVIDLNLVKSSTSKLSRLTKGPLINYAAQEGGVSEAPIISCLCEAAGGGEGLENCFCVTQFSNGPQTVQLFVIIRPKFVDFHPEFVILY